MAQEAPEHLRPEAEDAVTQVREQAAGAAETVRDDASGAAQQVKSDATGAAEEIKDTARGRRVDYPPGLSDPSDSQRVLAACASRRPHEFCVPLVVTRAV